MNPTSRRTPETPWDALFDLDVRTLTAEAPATAQPTPTTTDDEDSTFAAA